jgi:integrase
MPLDFSPKYKPRTRALAVWEVDKLIAALPAPSAVVVAFIVSTGATCPSEVEPFDPKRDIQGQLVHLRGTKRETRDRWVPVPSWARRWFAMARKTTLPRRTNLRRDIIDACEAAGLERCSPNDLRRTFGHQLRARGVEPHLIAVMMGHTDSRMAERVYARLRPEELASLLRGKPRSRSVA